MTQNNNQIEPITQSLQKTVSISDMLQYPIYLNWFLVCDSYGNILKRPRQEDSCFDDGDFDPDIADGQDYYDELKKALIFPDFYIDDQIGVVSLLRNDKLNITLTVINVHNESEIKFIEANTVVELLIKFPILKKFLRNDIVSLSEC